MWYHLPSDVKTRADRHRSSPAQQQHPPPRHWNHSPPRLDRAPEPVVLDLDLDLDLDLELTGRTALNPRPPTSSQRSREREKQTSTTTGPVRNSNRRWRTPDHHGGLPTRRRRQRACATKASPVGSGNCWATIENDGTTRAYCMVLIWDGRAMGPSMFISC